jgi:hypothetical protein
MIGHKHAWVKPLKDFTTEPDGPAGAIDNGPNQFHPQRYARDDPRRKQAQQIHNLIRDQRERDEPDLIEPTVSDSGPGDPGFKWWRK